MKDLDVHVKKQYEAPKMELLVISGCEVMDSDTEHDNNFTDWGELKSVLFPKPNYYDK